MEERDIKKEITQRWVEAMDYLIFKGTEKNYKTFSENIGILYQRILEYKTFVKQDGRKSYVGTDHIIFIHEKYGVSMDFIMLGNGPILENEAEKEQEGQEGKTSQTSKLEEPGNHESFKPKTTEEKVKHLQDDMMDMKKLLLEIKKKLQ